MFDVIIKIEFQGNWLRLLKGADREGSVSGSMARDTAESRLVAILVYFLRVVISNTPVTYN